MTEPEALARARKIISLWWHSPETLACHVAAELRKESELTKTWELASEMAGNVAAAFDERNAKLSAENIALRERAEAAEKRAADAEFIASEANAIRREWQTKAAALELALKQYGTHTVDCMLAIMKSRNGSAGCSCGFEKCFPDSGHSGALDEALAAARKAALLEAAEHLAGGGTGYCLDSEQPHVWAARQVRELAEGKR